MTLLRDRTVPVLVLGLVLLSLLLWYKPASAQQSRYEYKVEYFQPLGAIGPMVNTRAREGWRLHQAVCKEGEHCVLIFEKQQ
jgi:hypothetical protein